jgi:hypothetical protein
VAGLREMAALSDFLPDAPPPRPRRMRLLRLRSRRVAGLEAIPERYRLQFLMLASDRLPGAAPAEVTALADRVASRVQVPARLLAEFDSDTRPLDAWFRAQAPRIRSLAGVV